MDACGPSFGMSSFNQVNYVSTKENVTRSALVTQPIRHPVGLWLVDYRGQSAYGMP
jgi:hypothetical protein